MKIKHRITSLLFFISIAFLASAESAVEKILADIETNNTTLKALRADNESMRLENLSGLTLADPEVSFSYMWGAQKEMPGRINVEVSQSFDFATLSGARKRVAEGENNLTAVQYRQESLAVLREAEQTLVNITFYNKVIALYEVRLKLYKEMADLSHKSLDNGNGTIVDVNSIDMQMYSVENELAMYYIERNSQLLNLQRLNGGIEVDYDATNYSDYALPLSFEEWYSDAELKNPTLKYIESQINLSDDKISLAKKGNLPTFSIGYVNELVKGSDYHGFSIGLSLPLWSNRGSVKAAKAGKNACQAKLDDEKLKFHAQLHDQYLRTKALSILTANYKRAVAQTNNLKHLEIALDAGQITMTDFLVEGDKYTELATKLIEAERDYNLALIDLMIYSK